MNKITGDRYRRSQCVDAHRDIFAVEKSFSCNKTPVHVVKNTWSQTQRSDCDVDRCSLNEDFAFRSGILPFECHHILSLSFCAPVNEPNAILTEEELDVMMQNHWFGESCKKELLKKQEDAKMEKSTRVCY